MIVVTVWITMKNLDNVEELVKTKENLKRELLRRNLLFEKVHELQMAKSIEINKKKKGNVIVKSFPRAIVGSVEHITKPAYKKKPEMIMKYVDKNLCSRKSPEEIAKAIINLSELVKPKASDDAISLR